MKLVTVVATTVLLSACGSDSSSTTDSNSFQTNNTTESSSPAVTNNVLLNNDAGNTAADGIEPDTTTGVDNSDPLTQPTNDTTTGDTGNSTDNNNNTDTTASSEPADTINNQSDTNSSDNSDSSGNSDTAANSDTTDTSFDQSDTDSSDNSDSSGNSDTAANSDNADTSFDQTDTDSSDNSDTTTNPENTDSVDTDPVAAGGCTVPVAGTTLVSSTTPVADIANPFYPEMGPQCVVPGSQFDGPGLQYGDFLLSNNAWNGQQSTWDWQQCIALTTAGDGSILPSWTFDWGNEDDLQPGLFEWEVKSYPEIIYGAKSNTEFSAPCATTGLPVLVQDLPEISIGYNYRTTLTNARVGDLGDEANNPVAVTGGDRNIAVESFFHSSCDIQRGRNSNIELELMVWLEVGNERFPSGSAPAHTFTSTAGHTYDVYTKPGNDQYLAYVAQNVVQADTLDWSEFINNTRANASTYGIRSIQDSWCLANILLGSEIWWGQGSVNFDYYQITSRY